ncbi:MAG: methyltransferase domain-containing protein [Myxococcota bacterium]
MANPLSVAHPWDLVAPGYLEHNLDDFTAFASRALELAAIGPADRVIDVACGPGSLAIPAAAKAQHVQAVDFSQPMLAQLRERLSDGNIQNVSVTHGDGQALPFEDAMFDAGFSMFGLMFFPDRARGFAELRRVLRPGARAVVSSWVPMDDIVVLSTMFEALFEAAPELAPTEAPPPPPLSNPASLIDEMSAAGFEVEVTEVTHPIQNGSLEETLAASRTSFAPLCLMAEQLGDRFEDVWRHVCASMLAKLGPGPVSFPMRALFGVGRAI